MVSKASVYDVVQEYNGNTSTPDLISISPYWAIAIVHLGRPITYSRFSKAGIGKPVEGVYERKSSPTIITDDCVSLQIDGSKRSHIKNLNATLKPASGLNYLDQDVMITGDWLFAWNWNNPIDKERVLANIRSLKPSNGFMDGLKFVGRVFSIRKQVRVSPGPAPYKTVSYQLQGVGFSELENQFFYDLALASAVQVEGRLSAFLSQIGLDFSELISQEQVRAGSIHDNVDRLVTSLINLVLGSGSQMAYNEGVNAPVALAIQAAKETGTGVLSAGENTDRIAPVPQAQKEAPFSYLVPVSVGSLLGIPKELASKGGSGSPEAYGFADVMQTLTGVQHFITGANNSPRIFFPVVDTGRSKGSRWYCDKSEEPYGQLKGTYLIVEPSFVNIPIWSMLQQFLNPTINEMYTALKVAPFTGRIMPTLVIRQIPFSTESIPEAEDFSFTRFLALPRWRISPAMVRYVDIGKSDASRTNFVHIYGNAANYAAKRDIPSQLVRNPPIFDEIDIMRSGMRSAMDTVDCAIDDQFRAPGAWMEAIADWRIGSHHTLNGTISCVGIQAPIAEGDNIEFEGIAYQIESVAHHCNITSDGKKSFSTSFSLTNGMPVDQGDPSALGDFPRYPGFINSPATWGTKETTTVTTEQRPDYFGGIKIGDETTVETTTQKDVIVKNSDTIGDTGVLTSQDPGISSEIK